jgi:hypothetical protein
VPDYTVHYFPLIDPVPPRSESRREQTTEIRSDGRRTTPVTVRATPRLVPAMWALFEKRLEDLFTRSAPQIPHQRSRAQTIRIARVRSAGAGEPRFGEIPLHEPIIYFVSKRHNNSDKTTRRATVTATHELRGYPGFDDAFLRSSRTRLTGAGDPGGRSWIVTNDRATDPWLPPVAEVFSDIEWAESNFGNLVDSPGDDRVRWPDNLDDAERALLAAVPAATRDYLVSQPGPRRTWARKMAEWLARAAFHEIAHCKSEYPRRPPNPRWENRAVADMHSVPGARILGATVVYDASPSAADLQTMGKHMLCPVPFFKLDQPPSGQFFNVRGGGVRRTPVEAPAPEAPAPTFNLDDEPGLFDGDDGLP